MRLSDWNLALVNAVFLDPERADATISRIDATGRLLEKMLGSADLNQAKRRFVASFGADPASIRAYFQCPVQTAALRTGERPRPLRLPQGRPPPTAHAQGQPYRRTAAASLAAQAHRPRQTVNHAGDQRSTWVGRTDTELRRHRKPLEGRPPASSRPPCTHVGPAAPAHLLSRRTACPCRCR